ncbi:hypothetical protein T310_9792, partial [Rasamsonia emersonii CBS 393.64]
SSTFVLQHPRLLLLVTDIENRAITPIPLKRRPSSTVTSLPRSRRNGSPSSSTSLPPRSWSPPRTNPGTTCPACISSARRIRACRLRCRSSSRAGWAATAPRSGARDPTRRS